MSEWSRGNSPLSPNSRVILLADADGREITPLAVGGGDGETHMLIGHENSLLHSKVWFALPPIAAAPAS